MLGVVFVASLIRATFGFGEALVAVPLLALWIPVQQAAPLAVLLSITIAAIVVAQDWRRIHFRSAGGLLLASAPGTVCGLLLLRFVAPSTIRVALAAFLLVYCFWSLLRHDRASEPSHSSLVLLFCGFSAGVLGGVSAVIGLHLWCPLPTGKAIVVSGPAWAAADRFRAVIHGRGGHGAKPQEAVDALEAACRCVVALQSIVSRAINPLDAAVVTVGTLHAGEAFNIVADAAVLEGTVRAFDEDVRRLIKGRIAEVLAHTAAAAGARAELDYVDGYPVLRNDAKVAEVMRQAAGRYLGEKAVGDGPREMAADDFARYAECVPGCYMSLGATAAGRPGYPNHHPHFTLDEDALPVGAAILAETALHLMQRRA